MRRVKTILGIGIALILIPALGFPPAWRSFLLILLGLWLCGLAVSMRRAWQFDRKTAEPVKKLFVRTTPSVDSKKMPDSSEGNVSPNNS